ncbi:MAG: hypothetical protein ACKV2Q_36575 [Planctomycetaceae bacterium]
MVMEATRNNTARRAKALTRWAIANHSLLAAPLANAFAAAANAWVSGNNSGSNETMRSAEAARDLLSTKAEIVLGLFNVKCDYPGLYPAFTTSDGREFLESDTNGIAAVLRHAMSLHANPQPAARGEE